MDAPSHYNYPDIFLEIDTEEDFKLIEIIINNFFNKNQYYFSLSQILDFLNKNSDLKKINNDVHRRWKKYRNN